MCEADGWGEILLRLLYILCLPGLQIAYRWFQRQ
jgi:hypothetical protein